jgi:[ribosomal protein S5]-alanine N-acetyltransferase
MMRLQPIHLYEDKTKELYVSSECQELINTYEQYYPQIGFHPPWIGYFIIKDGQVVGSCSFTGPPVEGKVEIAYWTFKTFEGQGIASFACQQLLAMARATDPTIVLTAKTAPEENASTKILVRNGFTYVGIVQDEGIGDAWQWVLTNR